MTITSAYAFDITGTWKLSTTVKSRPFNFCGLVSYGTVIQYNKNNTIKAISKYGTNTTGTKRKYRLSNHNLNIFLENKQIGVLPNFLLHHSSSNKTFRLHQISKSCFLATDQSNMNNIFRMCKIH